MLSIIHAYAHAQMVSNLDWTTTEGIPDPYSAVKSKNDNSTNVIVIDSKMVTGEDANISITKYNRNGDIIWQNTYNGASNGKDIATNLIIDNNDNIYISGTTYNVSSNYDILLLKYDSSGNMLLNVQYDGPANSIDIGTSICIDNSGYIYVAGASTVSGNMTDFVTLKFNQTGTLIWDVYYDYANGYESPIDISMNSNYTKLYVSGASASAINNWDIATVEYNLSGSLVSVKRVSSPGVGFDNPSSMYVDVVGNIYITGYSLDSTTSKYDIKTIKLNSALDIQWIKTYDEDQQDDHGNDISVDTYGNVYVVGDTKKGTDSSNIAILKYNSSGTLLWKKEYGGKEVNSMDKANKIFIQDNKIFIAAEYDKGNNIDIATIEIDSSGNVKWMKIFDGTGNGKDYPTSIYANSDDEIIVSGISFDGVSNNNITYKYDLLRINDISIGYTNDSSKYVKNEIIVRFAPEEINDNMSNNINKQFTLLSNLISDTTYAKIKETLIEFGGVDDIIAVKIYDWMTKDDSISIARDGEHIVMDKIWSTYRLILPTNFDENNLANLLSGIKPEIIYSQLNGILENDILPNDTYINNQISIINGPNNADINVEEAWSIETGRPLVKVGVLELAIDFKHQDFGGGTLATSKIIGGEEFYLGLDLNSYYNIGQVIAWHGTAVTGIIGALRNNNKGIAGIAGGDVMIGGDAGSGYGASIIALLCQYLTASVFANSVVKGSSLTFNGGMGYACQIISNASGTTDGNFGLIMEDALEICFENKCVFLSSRGNCNDPVCNKTYFNYPATLKKEWVINVGGSGNNGKRKLFSTNGDNLYESKYGLNVDVIALGSGDMVVSCQGGPDIGGGYPDLIFTPDPTLYTRFTGTSCAVPHVSGLAALMLSHHDPTINYGGKFLPNTLSNRDVEYLIKKYAHDVGSEGIDEVGNGLIDAGKTLKYIDLNHGYWVQHSKSFIGGNFSHLVTQIINGGNFSFISDLLRPLGLPYSPGGYYWANCYKHTYFFTIPLPSYATNNTTIVDKWVAHKTGISNQIAFNDLSYYGNITANIVGSNIIATLETYQWVLYQASDYTIIMPPITLPRGFDADKPLLSFQLYEPSVITSTPAETLFSEPIQVYPNPTDNMLTLSFNTTSLDNCNIKIYNAIGQLIKEIDNYKPISGNNTLNINTNEFIVGVYSLHFTNNNKNEIIKFIVHH